MRFPAKRLYAAAIALCWAGGGAGLAGAAFAGAGFAAGLAAAACAFDWGFGFRIVWLIRWSWKRTS